MTQDEFDVQIQRWLQPILDGMAGLSTGFLAQKNELLRNELSEATQQLEQTRKTLMALRREHDALKDEHEELKTMAYRLREEMVEYRQTNQKVREWLEKNKVTA